MINIISPSFTGIRRTRRCNAWKGLPGLLRDLSKPQRRRLRLGGCATEPRCTWPLRYFRKPMGRLRRRRHREEEVQVCGGAKPRRNYVLVNWQRRLQGIVQWQGLSANWGSQRSLFGRPFVSVDCTVSWVGYSCALFIMQEWCCSAKKCNRIEQAEAVCNNHKTSGFEQEQTIWKVHDSATTCDSGKFGKIFLFKLKLKIA